MTIEQSILKEIAKINTKHRIASIYGKYSIRFELSGEGAADSKARIHQATYRGTELFTQAIGSTQSIIAIKEWESDWLDETSQNKKTIYKILDEVDLHRVRGPFEQRYMKLDDEGKLVEKIFEEPLDCDLIVGITNFNQSQARQVINGIANHEMGVRPSIPQDCTFYSFNNEIGFRMYDDRGCDIWSSSIEKLRSIYQNFGSWILNYNRREIDRMFQDE